MTSLLIGFVGMVLLPAFVLSLIMGRFINSSSDDVLPDDNSKFTISSDTK